MPTSTGVIDSLTSQGRNQDLTEAPQLYCGCERAVAKKSCKCKVGFFLLITIHTKRETRLFL